MVEPAAPLVEEAPRLDADAVEQRLARLDEVLGQLERVPGATAGIAIEAVQALGEVYGEALARVLDVVSGAPGLLEAFDRDELLRHLLVLHQLHPHPLQQRVDEALERSRPYLNSHGGDVSLVAIEDGIAQVSLTGHCDGCSASTETMRTAIREAVLAAAPELTDVQALPASAPPHPAPVIPADSLLRRPVTTGGGGR